MEWGVAINAMVAAVALASAVLAALAVLAYRRQRRVRFLLVAGAFLVLLVRSVLLAAGFYAEASWESLLGVAAVGDVLLVFLLYLAVIR